VCRVAVPRPQLRLQAVQLPLVVLLWQVAYTATSGGERIANEHAYDREAH